MKKLILVRYGNWENGHLNTEGKLVMAAAAQKLEAFATGSFAVVAAQVDRAVESARIIAAHLGLAPASVKTFPELYAAEEDGNLPHVETAAEVITKFGSQYDTVIATISREYIETLPAYVLKNILHSDAALPEPTRLNRGELLVIDYELKTATIHAHD